MNEELSRKLKGFGLTPSETAIFLHLLEKGAATPPQIARGTGITRTNTYYVLEGLGNKGLIRENALGKRKSYEAKDPKALLEYLKVKQGMIEKMLPDLEALHRSSDNKPSIRFFEGWEEVKSIYLESLKAEDVRALGSTKQLSDLDPAFYKKFLKQAADSKVLFKDILTHASGAKGFPEMKERLGELYDARVLPEKYPDLPSDILIWGDSVAVIALEKPVFGTVIRNKAMAQTFRIMSDVIWNQLKPL